MLKEHTGLFHWTEQDADMMSVVFSMSKRPNNPFYGLYCTAIKGKPVSEKEPNHCWAVTNRYDPRIVALRN